MPTTRLLPDRRRVPVAPVAWVVVVVAALVAGCAAPGGGPPRADRSTDADTPRPERDGPPSDPPPDLMSVPDAEPTLEPIRVGGPNKPYAVFGESYRPITEDVPFLQRGLASWYGRKFHGARTSSGERYDMYAMTAAHPTLPIPSYVRVRNPANGREVVVRVNDRGPFHSKRIMDLSYTAALKLDVLRGVAMVELRRITGDEIRAGLAQRGATVAVRPAGPIGADTVTTAAVVATSVTFADTVHATDAAPGSIAGVEPAAPARAPAPAPTPTPTQIPTSTEAPIPPPISKPPTQGPTVEPDTAPRTPGGEPPRGVATASTAPPAAAVSTGWWLQFGAFRARDGALALQRQVADGADWLAPLLTVFHDGPWFRLQAGPFNDRSQAVQAGERARREARAPALVVERP